MEAACARLGDARAGPLPQVCLLVRFIGLTKGFGDPGLTVFSGFFLTREMLILARFYKGFDDWLFLTHPLRLVLPT